MVIGNDENFNMSMYIKHMPQAYKILTDQL